MAQNKKDWIPDYKRQVWIGNFHRFKNPGDSKPTRRDLCTFNDATYNSKGNVRSEKALNSYLRSLHEDKEAELLQKLNYESPEKIDKKVILLQDAINEFKKYNKPTYGLSWQRQLTKHLDFWLNKLGNIPINEITQLKALKIRNKLKCGNAYKNRHFAALSSLLTACVEDHEYLDYNPLWKLKKKHRLEENSNVGKALTALQLKDLRREAENIFVINENDKDSKKSLLNDKNKDFYLLILMALYTGARKSELTKLKWSDYDGSKVVFRKTKNKQERVCPIFGEVKSILDDQEYTKNKIFMYKDYRKPWNKVRIKAKLGNFRFHDLRHSTVSYLLENKVPHLTVAEIVGHNSYEMIKRYNQINPQHLFDSLKTLEKQLKVR